MDFKSIKMVDFLVKETVLVVHCSDQLVRVEFPILDGITDAVKTSFCDLVWQKFPNFAIEITVVPHWVAASVQSKEPPQKEAN